MKSLNVRAVLSFCLFLMPMLARAQVSVDTVNAPAVIQEEDRYKRLTLFVDSEFTMLKSSTASLVGAGPRLSALYALSPTWSLNFGIAQALSLSSGLSALYTAVNLHASYALTGSFASGERTLSYEGESFLRYRRAPQPTLMLSGGLEQYFLNASSAVISGSGLGISLLYCFPMWGADLNAGVRGAYLLYGSNTLMVFAAIGGLSWTF